MRDCVGIVAALFLSAFSLFAQAGANHWQPIHDKAAPVAPGDASMAKDKVNDPAGDVFGTTTPRPDVSSLEATISGGDLVVTISTFGSFTFGTGAATDLVGIIDIDSDRVAGETSANAAAFCPSDQRPVLGTDFYIDIGATSPIIGGLAAVFTAAGARVGDGQVSASSGSVTVRIPVGIVGITPNITPIVAAGIGNPSEPTDCVPGGGAVAASGGGAPPTVAVAVEPTRITSTRGVSITWVATNFTNCSVSGGQPGSSFSIAPTNNGGTATTTVQVGAGVRNDVFFVTCNGPGGSTTGNAILAVGVPPPPAPTPVTNSTKGLGGANANAAAGNIALSDGGRYVVFESGANNLVSGDTNGSTDVFLRDTVDGSLQRVSVDTGGAQLSAFSGEAKVSRNGRIIAFTRGTGQAVGAATSKATKPITGGQICLRDLNGNTLICVSRNPAGTAVGNGDSGNPSLSGDGKVVAFESAATNLLSVPDNNGVKDVFAFDSKSNTTTILSNTEAGQASNGNSTGPHVSCAGTSFAFESLAKLTTGTVQAGRRNIYAISPFAAKRLVSVGVGGAAANGDSTNPRITDDGRYVIFESTATNLVSDDSNGVGDLFVADLVGNTMRRISVSATGTQANGASRAPRMSCDGTYVTFDSDATNLVSGDANGTTDTFVLDRSSGVLALISRTPAQPTSNGPSSNGQVAPDGSTIGFDSTAPNLGSTSGNAVGITGVNPFASANYSGEWYDPAQSGHGIAVDQLADGRLTAYWFTFDPSGAQAWFGGVGPLNGNVATVSVVRTTGPRFLPNYNAADAVNTPIGTITLTFTSCDRGRADFALDSVFGTGFMTLQRLTAPVGVNCTPPPANALAAAKLAYAPAPSAPFDDGAAGDGVGSKTSEPTQGPIAAISGAWYDPSKSGQGLLFENLGNGLVAAAWFTQGPSGGQAWFSGIGTITDGNRAHIDVSKPAGGRWIPNFNAALVTRPVLGTLDFTVSSCNAGTLDFNLGQGFGAGSINLQPLFRPVGAICN